MVGTLATWTGFWIGTSLQVKLLKYLFRDSWRYLIRRQPIVSHLDRFCEKYGLMFILVLRLSPHYFITVLTQVIALTEISYENFVFAGFSALVPIFVTVYIGCTSLDSLDEIIKGTYTEPEILKLYKLVSTIAVVVLCLIMVVYHIVAMIKSKKTLKGSRSGVKSDQGQATDILMKQHDTIAADNTMRVNEI